MKNIFKILFFGLFVLIANESFAQGGVGTQVYDFEQRWLCDSTPQKTFYRLDVHRPGQAAVTVGNYLPDGTPYTVTSSIQSGPCTVSGSFPDSTYTYQAIEACDFVTGTGGTGYFVLIRIATKNSTGVKTVSTVGTFRADNGNPYTPTGTHMDGFCAGWGDKTVSNMQNIIATNTTGSISSTNGKFSVSITNIGTVKGTVTVNSTAMDLYPGQRWWCDSQEDPVSNELLGCPAVNYDCTASGSTTFLIVRKGD